MPCQCNSCRSEALRLGLSSESCNFCNAEISVTKNKDVWYQFVGKSVACEPCFKKHYKICRICGMTLPSSEMASEDINFRGENICICQKCATSQFKTCGSCSKLSYKGDLTRHGELHYCYECFSARFETCHVCHKIHPKEEVQNKIWQGQAVACNKCFSWHGPIIRYEHTANMEKRGKGPLFYGIELEVEVADHVKESRGPKAQQVLDCFDKGFVTLKEDRSIMEDCGFEIVTAPAERRIHEEIWNKFFDKLPDGLAGDTSTKCGLHIHASRAALSLLGIGKMLVFLNDEGNKPFVECIANRSTNKYCKVYKKNYADTMAMPTGRNEDRHEALNLQNSHTVELRIFKSTLKRESFLKALEFFDALIHFSMCGNYSISHCRLVDNFVKYVDEYKHDYPHLQAFILARWVEAEKKAKDKNDPAVKWINKYGFGIDGPAER